MSVASSRMEGLENVTIRNGNIPVDPFFRVRTRLYPRQSLTERNSKDPVHFASSTIVVGSVKRSFGPAKRAVLRMIKDGLDHLKSASGSGFSCGEA